VPTSSPWSITRFRQQAPASRRGFCFARRKPALAIRIERRDGLANRSGLVGKNLLLHPFAAVGGIFEEPLEGYKGPFGCSVWSQEFYETSGSRGFLRGFTFEPARGFPPVCSALWLQSQGRLPWGAAHHGAAAAVHDPMAVLAAICEDLPDPGNSVTLDSNLKDSHGIPAPKVICRLSENSRKMLDFGAARAAEVLRAAGAHEVYGEKPWKLAGWHLMGTARMGTDPERSVVNEWGRCHDVRNVFIVEGSIFVTAAGVNPTATIQALAPAEGVNVLRELEATLPIFVQTLLTLACIGYYSAEPVLLAVKGDARPPHPRGYEIELDDWSMLDRVRARGRLYREC
jgi:choline dehydrogenase-like flavoprotein